MSGTASNAGLCYSMFGMVWNGMVYLWEKYLFYGKPLLYFENVMEHDVRSFIIALSLVQTLWQGGNQKVIYVIVNESELNKIFIRLQGSDKIRH